MEAMKRDRGMVRIDGNECKGCGLCVEACPPNHPNDKDPSLGTPGNHPNDKDLSLGTPANHPNDKDPSLGTPGKVLRLSEELNHYGYRTAMYAGAGCTGCGICFMACPEPGAITVYRVDAHAMAAARAAETADMGEPACTSN